MSRLATQGNHSKHSNYLNMKDIYNATDKQFVPILCPVAFNAATRELKPTLSDLEQLLSMEDHKLGRLSPLLPVRHGVPVHITQNTAPKLGVANGFTGTVVGYQFPRDTKFMSLSSQESPTRPSSKPLKLLTTLKGLFLCKKLQGGDFKYFAHLNQY